jgi:hypothetical protein
VSTAALSLYLFMWTRAEAATESRHRLPVDVYDYAGVAPDIRAAAAEVTRHIYAAIGIDIVWVDRCPLACNIGFSREAHTDTQDGHLMVTILPDGMSVQEFPAGVLGAAPENGSVAYAFFGRIRAFAFDRNLLMGTLLGHVIAHEVGHILLREGHAPKGLMRAKWVDGELVLAKLGRLGFTAMQARRIRSRFGVAEHSPNLDAHRRDEAIGQLKPRP